jgi:hypothetical protein
MNFSASRTGLLLECQYWARPDIQGPPEGPESEKAQYGTRVHELAEMYAKLGPPPSTPGQSPEIKDALALAEWITRLPGQKFYEIKLAYSPTTGQARVLPETEARDYSGLEGDELPGTADFVSLDIETAYVVDYKTGATTWEAYREQLNLLALAACRKRGLKRAVCIVLKVFDGECYDRAWVLEEQDLLDFEIRIVQAAKNITSATPQPGVHCVGRFCALAGTCPATRDRIEKATDIGMDRVFTDGKIENDDHFRELIEVRRLLRKSEETLKERLQEYTGDREIPLLNGKKYKRQNGKFLEVK